MAGGPLRSLRLKPTEAEEQNYKCRTILNLRNYIPFTAVGVKGPELNGLSSLIFGGGTFPPILDPPLKISP